ncbi:ACT domain-containing protein [Ponticaulis profundi]|uniref:ACT domain-containing protein n=1 Tax=Ponticaulis profundi TaxID=2665222 RepID=A0ABW1S6C8_9PROT
MAGEKDLRTLLSSLAPELAETRFVFATSEDASRFEGLEPLMLYREDEGVTAILEAEKAAQNGLDGVFPCRRITLKVHSALDAVGMIASVAEALRLKGIPANTVAGFYHDHIFVPERDAQAAMHAIQSLSDQTKNAPD